MPNKKQKIVKFSHISYKINSIFRYAHTRTPHTQSQSFVNFTNFPSTGNRKQSPTTQQKPL